MPVVRRLLLCFLALLVHFPASSLAGSAWKTAELELPEVSLPAHTSVVLGTFEGWEPERVQGAVLKALTDQNRGLAGRALPEGSMGPGPAARPTSVVADQASAPDRALVLLVSAREPEAVDKVRHKRVRYDNRYQVTRKTELFIDYKLVDPKSGGVVAASSVSAKPKPYTSPWNTDEGVAMGSAPDPGTLVIEVLESLAAQIVNQIAPAYSLRTYRFKTFKEDESSVVQNALARGRFEKGIEDLEALIAQFPESAEARFDLALALAATKRFDEAVDAAERLLELDDSKGHRDLMDRILEWQKDHATLQSYGFVW